jgi:type II secretory pathway component PulF
MTISTVIRHASVMDGLPRSASDIAAEISILLEQGFSLSSAFSLCTRAQFGGEDIALIVCAEETGNYGDTFKFLSEQYEKKKNARSKLLLAAVYPLFVVVLAAAATAALLLYADVLFPLSKELLRDKEFLASMHRGIISACVFLLAVVACCVYAASRIVRYPALYYVFSLLSFLTSAGIGAYQALGTALAACDAKLCSSLVRVQDAMKAGVSIEKAFASEKIFSDSLFYIAIAEINGTVSNAFFLIAQQIEQKRTRQERLFLQTAEPAMLLAAGVYMLLLLRSTVMPLLIQYGGIV